MEGAKFKNNFKTFLDDSLFLITYFWICKYIKLYLRVRTQVSKSEANEARFFIKVLADEVVVITRKSKKTSVYFSIEK